MKKRKAKRISPKNGTDTKINQFFIETEKERKVKLLKLIVDVIVKVTLEEFYSDYELYE